MSKNIEIHIDRIVLDGFDHLNKTDLNAVMQEHLTTMISEQGLPNDLLKRAYHRKLNGGEMKLGHRPETGQVGIDIAGGIFNGMNSKE